MLAVTPTFKTNMTSPVKRVAGKVILQDGTEVTRSDNLVKYKITSSGGDKKSGFLLRTAMSQIDITLLGEYPIVGDTLDVLYGVHNGTDYEYELKGKFEVTEAVYSRDKDTTTLTAYDNMMKFYTPYTSAAEFPTTLYEYLQAVCSGVGVSLNNDSLPILGELDIPEDYYAEIPDWTFRDTLEDICEVTCTQARILPNGSLRLEPLADTGEIVTVDNMLTLDDGDKWGGLNSLTLAREPQEDNIYRQDEADIRKPMTRNILDLVMFDETYTGGV